MVRLVCPFGEHIDQFVEGCYVDDGFPKATSLICFVAYFFYILYKL